MRQNDQGTTLTNEPKELVPARSGQVSKSSFGRESKFASRVYASISSLKATRRFLQRQLWAWPIIAALLFGGAGWWVHFSVEDAMRADRATDLNVIVDATVTALHVWMDDQRTSAQMIADDDHLPPLLEELAKLSDGTPMAERNLIGAPAQQALRTRLMGRLTPIGYVGYLIVAPNGIVLAADQDAAIGKPVDGYRKQVYDEAIAGKTTVSRPFRSPLLLADAQGRIRADLPTMTVTSPLKNAAGENIAAIGIRIRPEDQFTRILQVVRYGETGETYAFDQNGLLLSQSRFDDQLKQAGLLVDQPDAQSILSVELRDPGVNMVEGERPTIRRPEQPLTRLATEAIKGEPGFNADGYRDYRGVPRVGAWRWLKDYDFGIGTEIDVAEAFRPVYILRLAFWSLMALLALCAIGIFLGMLYISRQQRLLQKATLTAMQLGQYALGEKLGSGGMGTVYRARHSMLRRPTAIKLLNLEKISDATIARFEREVQLTSSLNHPNTVAVFDYGRTPDGIFYYAMEYLDGFNLDDLVKKHGPLSEARMVFILKQVCGALAEAHSLGIVHRDIKPANIFLTCRGGLHDFVKVLDFGLVKTLTGGDQAALTNPNAVTGTPYYMSPEAVNQPDQVDTRADVYALAAVGYYLLTGTPVFDGTTVMEICLKHVRETPAPPSSRLGRTVSSDLESLLLRCLLKSPADRPRDAAELLTLLESCTVAGTWAPSDAAAWWASHSHVDQPDPSATIVVSSVPPLGDLTRTGRPSS